MIHFFLLTLLTIGCASNEKIISKNYDGSKFHNLETSHLKSFWDLLKWQLTSEKKKWPEWVENTHVPEIKNIDADNKANVTFINHATFLLQIKNLNILTDPIFSKRASPVSWAGPQRVKKPGLQIEELPRIDVVLISHNHYDHMDAESIKWISEKFNPLFIVPLANSEVIKKMGAKNIIELDWWGDHPILDKNIRITLVPAHHWSSRTPFDRNDCLWGGFVIKQDRSQMYFAGDTGYGKFFKSISEKLGPMDLSIIPIGAYEPRWFMKEHHINPDEAVQAHIDLKSKKSIGMHFGTFQLTDEGIDDPVIDLKKALEKSKISAEDFIVPENGQSFNFVFSE